MTVTVGVIGAGAWGTALAQSQAIEDRNVILWAREQDVVDSVNNQHENTVFLPTVELSPRIKATTDLSAVIAADVILLVTPAQYMRANLETLKELGLSKDTPLVVCSKGIEIATGKLLSQVMEETLGDCSYAILTGPTFASEIARGMPSAATLAAKSLDKAQAIQEILSSRSLRLYASQDLIGTQIGGAVKNVIAIACGAIDGLELGESARAALITRGLAEMSRLTKAMGGQKETLMGMCGIGDMMLTCNSMQSRNFSLGVMLGQGRSLQDILSSRHSVTEGVYTAEALMALAKKNAIDMPISEAVYRCIQGETTIKEAVERMLERPLKPETV